MKYRVTVENEESGKIEELVIGVVDKTLIKEIQDEKKEHKNNGHNNCETDISPEICFELSKAEYEHSIRRSDRLDNKIYILLTVCGFIFVMLVNAISNIENIEILNFEISNWIIAYDFLLIVTTILTMVLLGSLIYSLSGIELKRYDSNLTYEMNLTSLDKRQVARFAILEYEIAKKHNNDLINKRYKRVNTSVKFLIIVVVLLIILSVSGSFAKIDTIEYRESVDMNQQRDNECLEDVEKDIE